MANYMMGRKEEVQFHCQETIFFLFWFEAFAVNKIVLVKQRMFRRLFLNTMIQSVR